MALKVRGRGFCRGKLGISTTETLSLKHPDEDDVLVVVNYACMYMYVNYWHAVGEGFVT